MKEKIFYDNNYEYVDDELNQLYSHVTVVKENKNLDYRKSEQFKKYRELWKNTAVNYVKTEFPLHLDKKVTSYINLEYLLPPPLNFNL